MFHFDEFGVSDLSVISSEEKEYYPNNNFNINIETSEIERLARLKIKSENCYLCGKKVSSFCNSHSLPRFVLKNIANEGEVFTINLFLELPHLPKKYGINNTGVFYLICRDTCDEKTFSEYETPDLYKEKPTQNMLAQIAMKTYLKWIYKEKINFEKYNIQIGKLSEGLTIKSISTEHNIILNDLKYKRNMRKLCLGDYENKFKYAKNYLDKHIEKDAYNLIFWHKLNYRVPIAFQGWIGLVCDLSGEIINESDNIDPDYKTNNLHICIFPLKTFSVIFMFKKKTDRRLKSFCKDFNKLNLQEKLQLISYMVCLYSEEVYVYKLLKNMLTTELSEFIKSIAGKENSYFTGCKSGLNKSFDLSKRILMPNLLSQQYKIA